jgi:hypothetical protein
MKKIFISILIFSSSYSWASKQVFVCTAADKPTQIMYRGKLFSVSVDSTCIKLLNLEDKKLDWSWKVSLKNSLGDLEGSRHDCSKNDEGWIGNPVIWRSSELKLIAFNSATNNFGFSASSFNCQINAAK